MRLRTILSLCILLVVSACKNDNFSLKLIPIKSGDKWGYIDKQGKIQINPQFNEANVFVEGLALVRNSDDKIGFINEDGKYIINPMYKDASFFHDGLALVVSENSKPQFIDKAGNVKITINNADQCGVFNENLALIETNKKWGFVDNTGTVKIPPIYEDAGHFSEGLAPVMIKDKDGNFLWGYVNTQGKLEINCQFKRAYHFSSGCAAIYDGNKYGFIDKTGKYIINPQFDDAGPFENGFAVVKQGNDFGYVDEKGKIQINPQFKWASKFASNDLAVVENSNKQMGFIDKSAKYIINPQFEYASKFYGDIAYVVSSDKVGLIGKDGKFIVNPQFDNIHIIDPENSVSKVIKSDFFDVSSIAKLLSNDFSTNSYKQLGTNNNLLDLRKVYTTVQDDDVNTTKVRIRNKIDVAAGATISDLEFAFNSDLYTYETIYKNVPVKNYWGGGVSYQKQFDHLQKTFSNSVNIRSLGFRVVLDNNGIGKAAMLSEKLQNELAEKTKTKLVSTNYNESKSDIEKGEGNFALASDDLIIFVQHRKSEITVFVVLDKKAIADVKNVLDKNSSNSGSGLSNSSSVDSTSSVAAPAAATSNLNE